MKKICSQVSYQIDFKTFPNKQSPSSSEELLTYQET